MNSTDGLIYGFASGSCVEKVNSGINSFLVDTKKKVNLATDTIASANAANLIIYNCAVTGCVQTVGFAKFKTYVEDATVINQESDPTNWANIYETYFTDATGTTPATETYSKTKTYYKVDDAYFSIKSSGGEIIETVSDDSCTASTDVGTFSTTDGDVCLGKDSNNTILKASFQSSTTDFLLNEVPDGDSPFTVSGDGILIKETQNLIYYDNSPGIIIIFFLKDLLLLYN